MTLQMTATELKARLLAVLDQVTLGEEVEITKHGRTVARLSPASGPAVLRDVHAGVVSSTADDEALFTTGVRWDAS